MMSAYVVFTREKTLNKLELAAYLKEAQRLWPGMRLGFLLLMVRTKT
jgi:hypothetical protein